MVITVRSSSTVHGSASPVAPAAMNEAKDSCPTSSPLASRPNSASAISTTPVNSGAATNELPMVATSSASTNSSLASEWFRM